MRLFVALDLTAGVKDELARLAEGLAPGTPGARWVPRDNYHVTLSFLGTVEDERVEEIAAALQRAVEQLGAGAGSLGDIGAFPSRRRARVIWVGLSDPDGVIEMLGRGVVAAMAAMGFPGEDRAFHPHVTIARRKEPAPFEVPEGLAPSAIAVPVDEVTLFRSHLGRPAPRYEPLGRFRLP